ncbi:unnamed protein product [Lathyrus oleraceus]
MASTHRICKHDVFLSFRGTDTRNTFTDHLYHHLIKKGISVFKDDQNLQKGESISPQLLQAIRDSRVSIVVFSKAYSKSKWCLDEIADIAECHEQLKQTAIPVFYDVDPSHVRKQTGVFKSAFELYTKLFRSDLDKVDRWRRALTHFANLVGFDVRDKPEFTEIEKIVQAVIKALNHKFSGFSSDLVGMQPRVQELEKLLKLNSKNDDFRVLGIWGMGGVGKTTHATVLYDRISYQFDARCFISNTSKLYMEGGVVAVQKQILRQTLDERNLDSYDTCEIAGIMLNRLHSSIKVLLVLDNVDQLEQLQELGINPNLLWSGSRIIITTRDEHILRVYGADTVHKVPMLDSNDACELFRTRAFRGEDQSSDCVELIPEILKYAQNLPLAIKVIGSFLCTRDATQWRDALDRLKNNPDSKIMDVLQMSVDGLQHQEKEIFLHIACFFKGEREVYVNRILDACGLHPHIGIQRILEKSLITIKNQEIHMHDMLQKLGKKIVRHRFPEEPGSWSRLWQYHDFYQVLTTETGTINVKAIVLDQKESFSKCRAEGFSKMRNLALLILYHNNFSGNLDFLSNNLRYLLWHGCPFTSLPSNFEPYYLVELNMPHSSIQRLWEGRKELPNLKRMDLSNTKYLIETPKFFWTPKLERLDFTGCTNLIQVHPSIGHLTELVFLCLQNCSSLVDLDFGSVSRLSSLRVLRLSGCTKLEKTPDFNGASNLEYLDMDECTTLSKVHESIGDLTKLKFLSLRNCTNLVEMPDRIKRMVSLVTLDFYGCSSLTILPSIDHMSSLISLDLSFCNLHEVPNTIKWLFTLERLNLQGNKLRSLPDCFYFLANLAYVNLSHCHELKTIELGLPRKSVSGGKYFNIAAGSRDHRSGLYIFDCPKFMVKSKNQSVECSWLQRLLLSPRHFRGGFDIVVPCDWKNTVFPASSCIPRWFNHQFDGGSIVRIVDFDEFDKKFGFAFCVAFEVSNHLGNSGSPQDSFSSTLPHPLYLSFESEHTEERFDMPLNLELHKIDGCKYLWLIYISREHCHFLKTGAHITFKACPGLLINKWGVRLVTKNLMKSYPDSSFLEHLPDTDAPQLFFDYVQKTSIRSGTKIQLPYNWLVTEKEEVENSGAKSKETDLSNLGL